MSGRAQTEFRSGAAFAGDRRGGMVTRGAPVAYDSETPMTPASRRPQPSNSPPVRVVRKHHALVRLTHWVNVPVLAALIASGLSIYWAAPVFRHPRDPVTGSTEYLQDVGVFMGNLLNQPGGGRWVYERLGLGTSQLAVALNWHWLFAYLFMLNGLLYAIGLVAGGGWRALLPRTSDVPEAFAMIRYYAGVVPMKLLRRPWPHPVVRSKYNALQRSAYFAMPLVSLLAILSGWAMHKPSQLGWLERAFGSYDGARVVHFLCMVAMAGFVVPHVVMVVADGWDTFRSMVTGWSKRVRQDRHGA